MQLDRRRELFLKAIPERKKTSKKLKQQVLQDIYSRASSLPQKKSLQAKQNQSSLPKKYPQFKGQSYELSDNERQKIKLEQKQQLIYNQQIHGKNQILPKQLHAVSSQLYQGTEVLAANKNNTDNQRTKIKRFSQKEDRSSLTESQQKNRLKTLQDILKKKDSKRLIRESFLHNNIRNSPIQSSQNQKNKKKDNKMINLKYAFENRKFTNLSKYKMSNASKNSQIFGQSKLQGGKQSNLVSRKVSKQNSKKRIRTSQNDKISRQDTIKEDQQLSMRQKVEIRDLNLAECIDSENCYGKESIETVLTLQDSFLQAFECLKSHSSLKKNQVVGLNNSQESKDLQRILKRLNSIESQTGSMSRKTALLLGKVNFYLGQYKNSIYYLQNVFRQSNYDLSCIDSLRNIEGIQNQNSFYNEFYFLLAQSYKRMENYLCTIKVLDQWELNIVKKIIGLNKVSHEMRQYTSVNHKRTISHLSQHSEVQNPRNHHSVINDYRQKGEKPQYQLQQKKRSHSILRQNSEGYLSKGHFSSIVKQKQRAQSMLKKQSIKYKAEHFALKPKSKHLSIKTLSQINVNLDIQDNTKAIRQQELQKCPERQLFKSGYLMRARIQYEIKNFYASLQDYQRALACDFGNVEAGLQLATLYYKIGRKDKSISFLEKLLTDSKQSNVQSLRQIKYHMVVILYKCQRYQQSFQLIQTMQKERKGFLFEGQLHFYEAMNLIKLTNIFVVQSSQTDKQKVLEIQKQRSRNIEQVLVCLQKSIDQCCSDFYIYAAYFIRIYLLLFKVKHYYGAQYEIDRLKAYIDRKKGNKIISKQSLKQMLDYRLVSVEPFVKILNLQDLISITGSIICILKLKLSTGLQLISQIQTKVKSNKINLSPNIITIENQVLTSLNQHQQQHQANEVLRLLYQFKYYGLYTMRSYRKALGYLQRIREIDMLTQKQTKNILLINSNKQTKPTSSHQMFKHQSDKINYLTLKSLILMEEKKFEDALNLLKIVETESSDIQSKSRVHKKTISGNLDTISTVVEYKRQGNTIQTIKALCYILLYKYLESQKSRELSSKSQGSANMQIKIMEKEQDGQEECHQRNDEILLMAQDLLSQCLICDQENFEILFLISLIHYELGRYDSALNFIRQTIQLSDDHMIKHYYLKANMKLLLGKYQEAIKDYSNGITVFKQLQKEINDSKKSPRVDKAHKTITQQQEQSYSVEGRNGFDQTIPNDSLTLSNRTQTSGNNENQYYEEHQEMQTEIYLNRAIAYLKQAYTLQFETCHPQTKTKQRQQPDKYQDVRENIINLKSAAAQDVKQFFNQVKQKIKLQLSSKGQAKVVKTDKQKQPHQKKQQSPKGLIISPSQTHKKYCLKVAPYLQLLLHTSDLQSVLEISRQFTKQFSIKLMTDEDLMKYFYTAKELNNCLMLMDKIIKKHYLSDKNNNNDVQKNNHFKKYSSSKVVEQTFQSEPYFKSKRQNKASRANNQSEFNIQKYNTNHHRSSSSQEIQTRKEQQKIQKLIFDKKVLSSLKDSSNNTTLDYENALVTLLQEEENIRKSYSANTQVKSFEGGNIFKYSDLVFFIGVMYYLLGNYEKCIRYFQESYLLKKQRKQLFSFQNVVSKGVISDEDDSEVFQESAYRQEISLQNLRSFQEIYDNRIYSNEQMQYNIGLAYLMAGDYNSAYDYLEKYEDFVQIIQNSLTQNDNNQNPDVKKTQNKLKKPKASFKQAELHQNSLDEISVRTKSNQDADSNQQEADITPFPTHNRLCSIYPQRKINGKKFFISFCLPKIQLPYLDIFYSEQVQIAQSSPQRRSDQQINLDSYDFQNTKEKFLQNSLKKEDEYDRKSIKPQCQSQFLIKKQNIVDFLNILSLKDIEMKPIAPWIKKDKEKKCIRFTDNFLSESFDLKTQCTTQRRARNSSRKEMFGQGKSQPQQRQKSQKFNQQTKGNSGKKERREYQEKPIKKINAEHCDFAKIKQKQKPAHQRYKTIEHE